MQRIILHEDDSGSEKGYNDYSELDAESNFAMDRNHSQIGNNLSVLNEKFT